MSPCHRLGGVTKVKKYGPSSLSSHTHCFRLDTDVILKNLPPKPDGSAYRVILAGAFTKKEKVRLLKDFVVCPKKLLSLFNVFKAAQNALYSHMFSGSVHATNDTEQCPLKLLLM